MKFVKLKIENINQIWVCWNVILEDQSVTNLFKLWSSFTLEKT